MKKPTRKELEQYKRALNNMAKDFCYKVSCDDCPLLKDRCTSIDNADLVAYFLKEAGDGKE